jgi:hypothetical protein
MSHTFERPYRGPGVRLVNAIAGLLAKLGHAPRPLDAGRILERAARRARLRGAADPPGVREPLERLVEAFHREAGFHPAGRLLARVALEHFAGNRLRLDALLASQPTIAAAPLRPALIVVGLPRTGTTLLYNLLALDPRARALAAWESFFPVPRRPRGGTADRRRRTRWLVRAIHRTAPGVQEIHPLDAEGPEEDTWLLAHTFVTNTFSLMGRIPSYDDWLESLDGAALARSYGAYRQQLLWLQSESWPAETAGPSFWLLKSPAHLATLGGLLATVPEARIIQTHRDPATAMASTCSLFAVTRSIYSHEVDPLALGPEVAGRFAAHARRAAAARRTFPGQVHDLAFDRLVADPVEEVAGIYRAFDLDFPAATRERMERWLAAHREPPAHRYELAQFGLDRATVDGLFDPS